MNKAQQGLVVAGAGVLIALIGPQTGAQNMIGLGFLVILLGLGMTVWAAVSDKNKGDKPQD